MTRSARRAKKQARKAKLHLQREERKKKKLSLTPTSTVIENKLKAYHSKLETLLKGPLHTEFKSFIEELEKPHVPDRTETDTGSTETGLDPRGAS